MTMYKRQYDLVVKCYEDLRRLQADYSEAMTAGDTKKAGMLQERLKAEGYQIRVYVPFGTHWYPYFMRRLAERPANVWFFVSNFFRR